MITLFSMLFLTALLLLDKRLIPYIKRATKAEDVLGLFVFWLLGFFFTGLFFGFTAFTMLASFLSMVLVFLIHEYLHVLGGGVLEYVRNGSLIVSLLSLLLLFFVRDPITVSFSIVKGMETITTFYTHIYLGVTVRGVS